jgi:hypothetical protein
LGFSAEECELFGVGVEGVLKSKILLLKETELVFLLVEELVGGVVGELELVMSGLEFEMLLMLILETMFQIFNLLIQPVDMVFRLSIDLLAGVK